MFLHWKNQSEEKPICPKNKTVLREQQIKMNGQDLATFKSWFRLFLRLSYIHALHLHLQNDLHSVNQLFKLLDSPSQ